VFYIDLISRTLLPDVFEKAALAASVKVTRKKDDQPPTSHTCLLSFFWRGANSCLSAAELFEILQILY